MSKINYMQPAELFLGRDQKLGRGLGFKRFPSAASAIRFAVEESSALSLRGATLEVGSQRFSGPEIANLYADEAFPLPKKAA